MTLLIQKGNLSGRYSHFHKWAVAGRGRGKSLITRHICGAASPIYSLMIPEVGILIESNILKYLINLDYFFFPFAQLQS